MKQKNKERFYIILLLGLLSAIGPFSIDMYLPGFPTIAKDLGATVERVQLSLTSFFVGIAFGQLIYGPLIDRFGRKVPLIVGLFIYIAASAACALTLTVESLIFFRLLQALGSCAGMVASRALVRDYFPPSETAKVFSLLMLVIGVSPIIAPTAGGYIVHYWGWHWVFVVLAVLASCILAGVWIFLKDKRGPNSEISLMPRSILLGFTTVFKVPQFSYNAFAGGLAASGLYAYISGSAFVMMGLYKISEQHYGWLFGLLATGLIISSQVNSVLLRKYKSEQISFVAISFQAACGLLLLGLQLTGLLSLPTLILLLAFYLAFQGFVFPNTSAMALNPFTKLAGSASALMGSIQLTLGALVSFLVSVLHNNTALPMTLLMACCSGLSFVFLLLARRARKRGEALAMREV